MTERQKNFYDIVSQKRETEGNRPVSRILIAAYCSQGNVQREKIQIETYIAESIKPFIKSISGYLLIKGLFYLHLIESENPEILNQYMKALITLTSKTPNIYNNINVVYNSDENPNRFFKNWICENIFQTGPILNESDKTQQQIADRLFEIYTLIGEGAKKKSKDNNIKIVNECPLNIDDMSMLIHKRFMTLNQYNQLYLQQVQGVNDGQYLFPLRPPLLKNLEYLEIEEYNRYQN